MNTTLLAKPLRAFSAGSAVAISSIALVCKITLLWHRFARMQLAVNWLLQLSYVVSEEYSEGITNAIILYLLVTAPTNNLRTVSLLQSCFGLNVGSPH